MFRTLAYLELEAYSNPGKFKTRSLFRSLVCPKPEAHSEHCQTSMMLCKKYLPSALFSLNHQK